MKHVINGIEITTGEGEIERLRAENEALRKTVAEYCKEAVDDINDWAAYADEYFQKKHDLQGDLGKWKQRAIEAARDK